MAPIAASIAPHHYRGLNASDGMATPLAQEAYERFYEVLGGKPVHQTLATHWARVIEHLLRRRARAGC